MECWSVASWNICGLAQNDIPILDDMLAGYDVVFVQEAGTMPYGPPSREGWGGRYSVSAPRTS